MKAFQDGEELLFADAEDTDEAEASGKWIRGYPVEIEQ
jgi:hypothetical protein